MLTHVALAAKGSIFLSAYRSDACGGWGPVFVGKCELNGDNSRPFTDPTVPAGHEPSA